MVSTVDRLFVFFNFSNNRLYIDLCNIMQKKFLHIIFKLSMNKNDLVTLFIRYDKFFLIKSN